MRPRRSCEVRRYNSLDEQLGSRHLSPIKSTCLIWRSGGLVSTASTPRDHRDLDPTCGMLPRRPETK